MKEQIWEFISLDIKRKIKRHRSFLYFIVLFGRSNVRGSDIGTKVYLRDMLRNTLMCDIRRRLYRVFEQYIYIEDLIELYEKSTIRGNRKRINFQVHLYQTFQKIFVYLTHYFHY